MPWVRILGGIAVAAAVVLIPVLVADQLAPGAEVAVRTAAPPAVPVVDLVSPGVGAPLAPAVGPALPAAPAPTPPTPMVAGDDAADVVPVVTVRRGQTLWALARARVGRDLHAILGWIYAVQVLNDITNPDRIQPGPLIVPEPDAGRPVFMRRDDLPPQP